MNAGLLKEQISIMYQQTIINQYGEKDGIWSLRYATRARIIDDSGSRTMENDEIVHNYYKTFQVRSYVPVKEVDRIRWDNKWFRVLTIEHRKDYNDIIIKTELVND